MLKARKHICLLIGLLVSTHSLAGQFRGSINGKLIELNGDVFGGVEGVDNNLTNTIDFDDQLILYFRQKSGQTVLMSPKKISIEESKNTKYHLVFKVIDHTDESFTAQIAFYQNHMVNKGMGNWMLAPEMIHSAEVSGQLNAVNTFVFKEEGKPELKFVTDFDRIFSEAEKIARLKKKLRSQL